jgi:transposase
MDEIPQTSVEEFGHFEIVETIINKYKIAERIDNLILKSSNNQKITHSEAILSMIYQGLGFGEGRLYFAKTFFSNKPVEKLFGKNISADLFNDDVLAAALDAVFKFGTSKFFANFAFQILSENGLMSRFAHIHGRKYKK